MPQIEKTLSEKYKKPISLFDPDEAVAKGAAAYALIRQDYKVVVTEIAKRTGKTAAEIEQKMTKENKTLTEVAKEERVDISDVMPENHGAEIATSPVKISDALSRTYGVGALDERHNMRIRNILIKGDSLPANRTQCFYTTSNTSGISIDIFESESNRNDISLDEGTKLGTAELPFDRQVPGGTEIVVNLNVDNSGLLTLVASESTTNSTVTANFVPSGGLSESEKLQIESRVQNESVC